MPQMFPLEWLIMYVSVFMMFWILFSSVFYMDMTKKW
nr:ATP synthase F0 subunit 8 [Spelaeomysis bottazzii]UUL70721.1 ATP synthase F0 subunit 8 [Spelaeomysis bottazzii]